MRWRILKTLLHKEALRHATNRGGLALAGLLITASLLLAALNPAAEKDKPATLVGGIHHCFIHYDHDTPWVKHLHEYLPPGMKNNVVFRQMQTKTKPSDVYYQTGTGAIEIRVEGNAYEVTVRYPAGDRPGMAVYENWFWRESYRYFHAEASESLRKAKANPEQQLPSGDLQDDVWLQQRAFQELLDRHKQAMHSVELPTLTINEREVVGGTLDLRAAIATALVMFSLFFTCVYLMPSLTCEERERGLLLAQALSPATAGEILAAKFLFYPAFGIFLATLLAGIHNPTVLGRPFFWLSLGALSVGTLGIGMTVACLAKTQRAASLGALCYMLAMALVLLICQQNNITFIPALALEYHAPHILHATLTNQLRSDHWLNLAACCVLAAGWAFLAVVLFRRRGWQ